MNKLLEQIKTNPNLINYKVLNNELVLDYHTEEFLNAVISSTELVKITLQFYTNYDKIWFKYGEVRYEIDIDKKLFVSNNELLTNLKRIKYYLSRIINNLLIKFIPESIHLELHFKYEIMNILYYRKVFDVSTELFIVRNDLLKLINQFNNESRLSK
jgi:hypothetical protein